MLEVEVKYRVADPASLERDLTERGGRMLEVRTDIDQYFNAPDRDFARTDEALRIRTVGERSFVTYKGPKRDPQTKTREELELPLPAGQSERFGELLMRLGYRPTGVVRKFRQVYYLEHGGFSLQVCLDDVAGLGSFAEIEVVADESQFQAAKAIVLEEAAELGLTDSERRSYLEMLLSSQQTGTDAGAGG